MKAKAVQWLVILGSLSVGVTNGYARGEGIFLPDSTCSKPQTEITNHVARLNAYVQSCYKTGDIAFRVTRAVRRYSNGFSINPTDSSRYFYSGSRGQGDIGRFFDYESPYATFSYDKAIYASYNKGAGRWETEDRYTQSFTPENLVKQNIQESVQGSSWQNSYKTAYTYDAQGRLESYLFQNWDDPGMAWEDAILYTWHYTLPDKPDTLSVFNRNTVQGTWECTGGWYYRYNADETIASKTYFVVDAQHEKMLTRVDTLLYTDGVLTQKIARKAVPGGWENLARLLLKNSSDRRVLRETEQHWDVANTGWVNSIRNDYAWTSFFIDSVTTTWWDDRAGQWANSYARVVFGYESFVTAVNDLPAASIPVRVYPNPAAGAMTVAAALPAGPASLALYNMQGQCLWQKEMAGGQSINEVVPAQSWPRGCYILHLQTASGSARQSLVLQ